MSEFAIYELAVGGGMLALSPLPGRDGRYADDLAVVLAWGATDVISLTMLEEMSLHGAGDLHTDLRISGVRVWHLPVVDFGTPEAGDGAAWSVMQASVLAKLKQGGRVLAHCMGGCGRSGMTVLRLMAAAGEPPDAALGRLRGARPCAVETDAQLMWATKAG